jgi:hypothetical protein
VSGQQQLVQAKLLLSFGHLASELCPYCCTTTIISTVLFQRLQNARSCQSCSAPVTVLCILRACRNAAGAICVPFESLTCCRIRPRICLLRLDRRGLVVLRLLLRLGRFSPALTSPPPLPPRAPRPWPAAVTLRLPGQIIASSAAPVSSWPALLPRSPTQPNTLPQSTHPARPAPHQAAPSSHHPHHPHHHHLTSPSPLHSTSLPSSSPHLSFPPSACRTATNTYVQLACTPLCELLILRTRRPPEASR